MTKVVYPGTFDPVTRGHEELALRAARLFDEVIIAVATSRANTLFTLQERIEMANTVFADIPNIQVKGFDGLLINFVQMEQAQLVLRGLRAVSDFEYEFQLAGMNRKLCPEIETMFLTPSEQYMFISASMVREIARLHGDVSQFVSPAVEQRLQQKLTFTGEKQHGTNNH